MSWALTIAGPVGKRNVKIKTMDKTDNTHLRIFVAPID